MPPKPPREDADVVLPPLLRPPQKPEPVRVEELLELPERPQISSANLSCAARAVRHSSLRVGKAATAAVMAPPPSSNRVMVRARLTERSVTEPLRPWPGAD